MKYKIFMLVGKSKWIPDGYNMKEVYTYKLKEVDHYEEFDSFESAEASLPKQDVSDCQYLTILPIFEV